MTELKDSPCCDERGCDEDHDFDPEAEWSVTCEAPSMLGNNWEYCSERCQHGCHFEWEVSTGRWER